MSATSFLAGLPAILGLTGFAVYQLLQQFGRANPIVTVIVGKLRVAAPERVPDGRLSASAVDRLLRRDDKLRHAVSDQDFILLKKVLNQQFVVAILVYLICGALCAFGIVQYVREEHATRIDGITISGSNEYKTMTDLDPINVNWKTEGDSKPVRVYLENVSDGTRSKVQNADSRDRGLVFCPPEYENVRPVRAKGGRNSVRVVVETPNQVFRSEPVDLWVGITLELVAQDDKATLAALIDNSLVQNYVFDAEAVLPRKHSIESVVLKGTVTAKRDYPLKQPHTIDWEHAKIVFLSPESDRALVRPSYLIDDSLGVRPSESTCSH